MTRDRYLEMCEQMGREPKEDEIPLDCEDLPPLAIHAINSINKMGDRLGVDIGFLGKDYTNLPYWIDIYGIEDTELFLDLLNFLETRAIKQSQDGLKREREKLKRRSSGK